MKQNYPETTKKNSFIFYNSYKEHFQLIDNPQEALNLLYAIIDYSQSGKIPSLIGMAKMAFSFIKINIDNNNKKYQSICERNQKNGSLGGRPRTQKTQLVNQEPKKPDNDNDNDIDSDKDKDKDNTLTNCKRASAIERIIKLYPRVSYYNKALVSIGNAIQREVDKGISEDEAIIIIEQGANNYAKERKNEDSNFTKECTNWMDGGGYRAKKANKPTMVAF